jgi:hypothetical protein
MVNRRWVEKEGYLNVGNHIEGISSDGHRQTYIAAPPGELQKQHYRRDAMYHVVQHCKVCRNAV